ncbi:MAG: TolC family protein [Kiritimatiellae bacterium]|nr:TolC family protein [Kiritimatiellia bacterium]
MKTMMNRGKMTRNLLVPLGVLALGAGCATAPRHAGRPAPRPLGAQLKAAGDGAHEEIRATPTALEGVIKLEQALALALLHNPALEAYSHEGRAAAARLLQAGLLRNPRLMLEVEEVDRDGMGFDNVETSVALVQWIELGSKRRRRSRVAEAEGELAGWEYEQKRLEVFSATAQRFVGVLAAQESHALAVSMVELSEKTAHAVGERVKAGKEPPLQRSKAVAELEMAHIGLLEAENALEMARMSLAALWGGNARFDSAHGHLDTTLGRVPDLAALRPLLARNPDMARWESEGQLARASLASQKAKRVPDLKATARYVEYREDETEALAFEVGFDLPLFDRNQGNIAAAKHNLATVAAKRRAAETALSAELAEAHAALTVAQRKAEALRTRVVPAMQEAFDAAHEGYREGKFDFLDMLGAQRGLFEARGALVDALSSYHIAVAAVQQVTGTPIEALVEINVEESK